ncbi:hypothetical protein ACWDZ8_45625 [Streptomyces sp. NPDC003233]
MPGTTACDPAEDDVHREEAGERDSGKRPDSAPALPNTTNTTAD